MPGRLLHSFAKPSSESFINIVRGDMARLWDDAGNEYIDAIGSLWYCQIGHGRNEMADAIAAQVSTLETYSTFDPFTNPLADAVAEKVASLSPLPDARVFLCGSGSESIDTAMKLARLAQIQAGHPERSVIITRDRGYHGTNYGGTSAQGLPLN
jgi:adenosylmethionine-8-amino-7-oxononanoate aminotransferase